MDSAFFSPLDVEDVLESMEEVEETAVWGSTDSSGGNDLVNVALVVRKGSLVSREEVVAKVAATLHPRKQITGQVKYKSKFQIFHLEKSQFRKKKKMLNYQVVFLDGIPHNPQGKKLRHQLKETYSQ